MPTRELITEPRFEARAFFLCERLDLRALESTDRIAGSPLTLRVSGGGAAVLFRYGAVVLFDVAPLEESNFLAGLQPFMSQPHESPETESAVVRIEAGAPERAEGNTVVIQDAAVERLQLVAHIMGKSVALARYESTIAGAFDLVEPVAANLERKGRWGRQGKHLLRLVGRALFSEQKMIARVEMRDKPEILWERPDLERLYARLADEYEIAERAQILERKLGLLTRSANTVLDLQQNSRALRVEWYIVILIVIEILLSLYDIFLR